MSARSSSLVAALALLAFTPAAAEEWIADRDIASYCQQFLVRSDSPSGTVCVAYIQGFVDGLRTTEVPAQHELEFHQDETVSEAEAEHISMARVNALVEEYGPPARAGICLPHDLDVEQIIRVVARELRHGRSYSSGALDDYAQVALRERYPCDTSDPVDAQIEAEAEEEHGEGSVQ